jgi:hypothetical protein
MGITVVLLFPLGATYMRLFGSAQTHALLQIFSLCALLCGFGLGIKLATLTDYVHAPSFPHTFVPPEHFNCTRANSNKLYKYEGKTHTIFGTTIVALFVLQPFMGFFHHYLFKKTGGRTPVSYIHIWYGRIIMILAVINGGLGLKLANNTKGGEIAYGVVAGVVALLYTAATLAKRKNKAAWGFGKSNKTGLTEAEMGEERVAAHPQER